MNKRKKLIEHTNVGNVKPEVDGLPLDDGMYNYVRIINGGNKNNIEVGHQNILGQSHQTFNFKFQNNFYTEGQSKKPVGWLHKPS